MFHELLIACRPPYTRDHILSLRRQKTEALQNHEYEYFRNSGQGEARYGKYKYLKLEESKLTFTMNKLPLQLKHINP